MAGIGVVGTATAMELRRFLASPSSRPGRDGRDLENRFDGVDGPFLNHRVGGWRIIVHSTFNELRCPYVAPAYGKTRGVAGHHPGTGCVEVFCVVGGGVGHLGHGVFLPLKMYFTPAFVGFLVGARPCRTIHNDISHGQ